ncbi:hypothetical protein DERP_004892 [Dermatophagoides pteronyssinus]|uniref:Chitinase-3-like protein 1 n=1 Tax=Dermatophagoides pteronyssinus TaxID=6956 RepID=A0ABQ8JSU0_DERPT|nr:hypothetical protein DERP_004892 [Dermatophagoides pteronyssinus]
MTRLSFTVLIFLAAYFGSNIRPNVATLDPKTVCYYESWVHWRQGDGKMDPEDIDTSLCSHIVYSYFGIDASSHEIKLLDQYLMITLRNAKAMIAVGGASMSDQFSKTAAVEHYRETFVVSTIDLMTKYGFDGVMIDWSGMQAKDSDNFVKLLDKFDEKFAQTSFVMGVTLPATIASYDNYNIPAISNYVDFMNVLTLDYDGPWAYTVGHASALPEQLKTLEAYNKRGAPRHKMVMAVPFFARTWILEKMDKQDVGDKASGPGPKGQFTQTPGFLSYNELCVQIQAETNAFSITRDHDNTAIYAVYVHDNHAEWISFEDRHTLGDKARNITEQGYGGMSVYTLSNEDVHGVCGDKNPLLHAINSNYFRGIVTEPTVVTVTPVTHTTEHVTDIPGVFHCHQEGFFRDKTYCAKYYECKKGDFGLEQTVHHCPNHSQAFDEVSRTCVDHTKIPGC